MCAINKILRPGLLLILNPNIPSFPYVTMLFILLLLTYSLFLSAYPLILNLNVSLNYMEKLTLCLSIHTPEICWCFCLFFTNIKCKFEDFHLDLQFNPHPIYKWPPLFYDVKKLFIRHQYLQKVLGRSIRSQELKFSFISPSELVFPRWENLIPRLFKTILNDLLPKCMRQFGGILELFGYCRVWISNFFTIVSPF